MKKRLTPKTVTEHLQQSMRAGRAYLITWAPARRQISAASSGALEVLGAKFAPPDKPHSK